MASTVEKFRIAFSLAELETLLNHCKSSPDFAMENIEMIQRIEKAKRKAEFGLITPAFSASSSQIGGSKIGEISSQLQKAKCQHLLERKEAGETLSFQELKDLVTWKADNHLALDEEEQQTLNKIMMEKLGFNL